VDKSETSLRCGFETGGRVASVTADSVARASERINRESNAIKNSPKCVIKSEASERGRGRSKTLDMFYEPYRTGSSLRFGHLPRLSALIAEIDAKHKLTVDVHLRGARVLSDKRVDGARVQTAHARVHIIETNASRRQVEIAAVRIERSAVVVHTQHVVPAGANGLFVDFQNPLIDRYRVRTEKPFDHLIRVAQNETKQKEDGELASGWLRR
jgi:hypothetical protein